MKPVADIVSNVSTKQEQIALKQALGEVYGRLTGQFLELESEIARSQSAVIVAEAQGESWAQRTWRPILMFVLMGVIVVWTGMGIARLWWEIPEIVFPEMPAEVWSVLKIGLGGYIGGRSIEKVAKTFQGDIGSIGTVAMDHRGEARSVKAKKKAIRDYLKMGFSHEEAARLVEADEESE